MLPFKNCRSISTTLFNNPWIIRYHRLSILSIPLALPRRESFASTLVADILDATKWILPTRTGADRFLCDGEAESDKVRNSQVGDQRRPEPPIHRLDWHNKEPRHRSQSADHKNERTVLVAKKP